MTMFFGPRGNITKRLLDILHEVKQYNEMFLKLEESEQVMLNSHIKDKITILHEEERDLKKVKSLGKSIRIKIIQIKEQWHIFEKKFTNLKGVDRQNADFLYTHNRRFSGSPLGQQSMKDLHNDLIGRTLEKFQDSKWNELTDSECESEIKHITSSVTNLLRKTSEFYHYALSEYREKKVSENVFLIVYEFFGVERKHELGRLAQEHS